VCRGWRLDRGVGGWRLKRRPPIYCTPSNEASLSISANHSLTMGGIIEKPHRIVFTPHCSWLNTTLTESSYVTYPTK
jgi:hypothetical protein